MYNLYIQNELVATGLSHGELCQWLLDLDEELSEIESYAFRVDLGYSKEDYEITFEDYLYEEFNPELDMKARFRDEELIICEDDI